MPLPKTTAPPPRIQILEVTPQVDGGRFPVKRVVGDRVAVHARIFRDGHDVVGAAVRYRPPGTTRWLELPLEARPNDHWVGLFVVDRPGMWSFRVEAWTDRVASFQEELRRKVDGGQDDVSGELSEGAVLLGRETLTVEEALAAPAGDRHGTATSQVHCVDVDRELARFGAWYELFPRSWGGFEGVRKLLPQFAELGFDVVYLPPVHPIGHTNRKGRNNALVAGPDDPGSPWAIGSEEGGHEAIDPALGTVAEFERLVADAKKHGIEIAIDFAIQCSPDHPWLKEHPEWFNRRPDGTLKYAENPPKRYQDIYNVNFDSEDWKGLWSALRDVVLLWVERGVTVFRVDNPHTKPVPFWEWLDRRGAARPSRRDLPRRGVHAAGDDDDAREGRVRAELHVLHVEEHALGAARAHGPAARLEGDLPAERVREHAGHPPRVPPARRAACVRGAARARGDAVAVVRHLLRLRELRERCRCARGARSTSTRRSTRSRSARSTGRCCRSSRR